MAEGFDFVLARVADQGRSAAKRIVGRSDGSCETFAYDRVVHWFYAPKLVSGHAGMARLLAALATRPDVMLLMGGAEPSLDLSRPQLRRWADPDPRKNTLLDVPRAWLAVDVDGYGLPPPWGLARHLADAAAAIRDDALGEEFSGVECVVAATSQTGLVGEEVARLRLFFLLGQPYALADLRRWAQGAQAAGLPVDPSIFQPGQPVFTARPRFEGALRDPVPEPLRAFVLPAGGGGDRVALDVHRYDQRAREIDALMRHAEARCGGNWRLLLAATLGGPTGFFIPLTQALGMAARSPDSEVEIIDFVETLMLERADPGRQRQYGPRWLGATLRRFRRFDRLVAGEVAELKAAMFEEAGR